MIAGDRSARPGRTRSRRAPIYKDPRQPVDSARRRPAVAHDARRESRAARNGLGEQGQAADRATAHFSPELASKNFPNGIGGFARPSDIRGVAQSNGAAGAAGETVNRDARQTAEFVNAAQHWAVEHTRLGIPILMHEESLHGYVARGATSFPQAIALASTWDPDLVSRVFSVAAREARARGATLVLAPVVDIARDPRWGRIEETYGEDPYLVDADGTCGGPRIPGADAAAAGRQGLRHAEAFHRPRLAGERDATSVPRTSANASFARSSSRRSKRQ